MKEVKAYIKKHRLDAVVLALNGVENFPGMSLVAVQGCGRAHADAAHAEEARELVPQTKIEVVCSDAITDRIVEAIRSAAHTGLHGDGKIYVSAVDSALRISTGEQGEQAV